MYRVCEQRTAPLPASCPPCVCEHFLQHQTFPVGRVCSSKVPGLRPCLWGVILAECRAHEKNQQTQEHQDHLRGLPGKEAGRGGGVGKREDGLNVIQEALR